MAKKTPPTILWEKWNGGTNKLLSDTRIAANQVKESTNVWLVEDGVWQTRPGTAKYSADLGDFCDGWTQYVKSDGTREIIGVADGKIYRLTTSSKTELASGLTADVYCYFSQIKNYLYISNGTDFLRRYDGTNVTVYSELNVPTGLTPSRTGLSAGTQTYYYQVTAQNDAGETTPCTEASITVNKDRSLWDASNYITLDWTAPSGTIKRYSIYISDTSGYENYLTDVEGGVVTFKDDGTLTPNPYVDTPDGNTTGAPKFRQSCISQGRVWGIDDDTLYWSGSGSTSGNFNWHDDGGWSKLNPGGGDLNRAVCEYQGKVHVFKQNSIWEITLNYNSTYMATIPTPVKIIAGIGCVAPLSVVKSENDVFFYHDRGFFVLGNEPNVVSSVLRTSEISAVIRPYVQGITQSAKEDVCGYYKDGRIYYSVAYGSSTNNRIITYDREHSCWVADWTVGFKQIGEFEDSSNVKHLLGSSTSDGYLDEISQNYAGDRSVAFSQKLVFQKVSFGDGTDFATVKRAYIKLRNPRGTIGFEVLGTKKNTSFSSVASSTITPQASATGVGWDVVGDFVVGDSEGTPGSFEDQDIIRFKNINKRMRDVQLSVSATTLDSFFTLLGLKVEIMPITSRPQASWKL